MIIIIKKYYVYKKRKRLIFIVKLYSMDRLIYATDCKQCRAWLVPLSHSHHEELWSCSWN